MPPNREEGEKGIMELMTLDEAIRHAEEVAEEKENDAKFYTISRPDGKRKESCGKCAIEHRQLAKWLKELKQLREQTRWVPINERLPEPDVEVLVTDDAGGLATIFTDSIYESEATGKKEWYTSQCVTAWMPLPEPYNADEKDAGGI